MYDSFMTSERNGIGKAGMKMKFYRNRKKKDVKIYEPKKERVQRIQQQIMIMNRAIIGI